MRLIGQKHSEYKGKSYSKHWIVIPNKLLEKLGWGAGADLEAEIKSNQLVIQMVIYRIFLYDENRQRFRSEQLRDKDEFLEKAKLSKSKDNKWDTEVEIVPVKSYKDEKSTTVERDYKEKETYFGMKKDIERVLKEIQK